MRGGIGTCLFGLAIMLAIFIVPASPGKAAPDNAVCSSKVTRTVTERFCTSWQTVVTGQDTIRSCDLNNICRNTYINRRDRVCSSWATRDVPRQMCVWACKPSYSAVPGMGPNNGCYAGEQLAKRIQKAARRGSTDPAFRAFWNEMQRCDLGKGDSCRKIGVMYAEGASGMEPDDGQAAQYFDRACDSDDMLGCALLGIFLATGGSGLEQDEAKALAPMRKACEGMEAGACGTLALMHATGRGGLAVNRPEAARLFHQALALNPGDAEAATWKDWIARLQAKP